MSGCSGGQSGDGGLALLPDFGKFADLVVGGPLAYVRTRRRPPPRPRFARYALVENDDRKIAPFVSPRDSFTRRDAGRFGVVALGAVADDERVWVVCTDIDSWDRLDRRLRGFVTYRVSTVRMGENKVRHSLVDSARGWGLMWGGYTVCNPRFGFVGRVSQRSLSIRNGDSSTSFWRSMHWCCLWLVDGNRL